MAIQVGSHDGNAGHIIRRWLAGSDPICLSLVAERVSRIAEAVGQNLGSRLKVAKSTLISTS